MTLLYKLHLWWLSLSTFNNIFIQHLFGAKESRKKKQKGSLSRGRNMWTPRIKVHTAMFYWKYHTKCLEESLKDSLYLGNWKEAWRQVWGSLSQCSKGNEDALHRVEVKETWKSKSWVWGAVPSWCAWGGKWSGAASVAVIELGSHLPMLRRKWHGQIFVLER